MDERLVALIKSFLPQGSEVTKIYKNEAGEIKVDIAMPDGMGNMTCSLKKNHAGELYLE
ncbi:MAG: hypothetical protein FWE24_10645 [Defluviitaleaceae bacterium]|nr:hypothetical protein [Defluviitaleaceae bacterium]